MPTTTSEKPTETACRGTSEYSKKRAIFGTADYWAKLNDSRCQQIFDSSPPVIKLAGC